MPIVYGCEKRGAEGERGGGGHVLKQAGNDHTVWGGGINDLFMGRSGPS